MKIYTITLVCIWVALGKLSVVCYKNDNANGAPGTFWIRFRASATDKGLAEETRNARGKGESRDRGSVSERGPSPPPLFPLLRPKLRLNFETAIEPSGIAQVPREKPDRRNENE